MPSDILIALSGTEESHDRQLTGSRQRRISRSPEHQIQTNMVEILKSVRGQGFSHLSTDFGGMEPRRNACFCRRGPRAKCRFLFLFGDIGAVAVGAGKGSWLIEQNLFPLHLFHQLMTRAAGDILMSSLE